VVVWWWRWEIRGPLKGHGGASLQLLATPTLPRVQPGLPDRPGLAATGNGRPRWKGGNREINATRAT
jgi:hypothetical protein